MRASEFIIETTKGKMGDRRRNPTRGVNVFADPTHNNSDYTLNRVMMAVACADGSTDSIDGMDFESWAGRDRTAHPYTKEEQAMLKQAYKAAGAEYRDINRGDMDSEELNAVNKVSPVKSFKGYPR